MERSSVPSVEALEEAREILALVESLNAVEDLQELLDRLAEAAATTAGWRVAVLSIYLPEGALLGGYNLAASERQRFLASMATTPLERRLRKRTQIRAHAFPDTAIAYVPHTADLSRSAAFSPSGPGAPAGSWHPDDRLFILVRTGTGQEIGVLSLDEPLDGEAPRAEALGRLRLVERLLELGASFLHGRVLARDLRRSEEAHRALVDRAPVGIYRRSEGGRLLAANPRLCEIFGCASPEALLGAGGYDDLCDREDREAVRRLLAETGEARDVDLRARRVDGTPIRLRVTVRRDPDGRTQGIVEDVTESRRLEEQVQRSLRIEAIGTLASGVAHDFNNVLAGILGYASLLEQRLDGDGELGGMARSIRDAAQRAADLTRSLLGVARPGTAERARIDVRLVLGDCARLARATFDPRITTEVEVAPDTPAVEAAPGDLHRAILNLCINARDAMPAGGRLVLAAAREAGRDRRGATGAAAGPWLCLEIRDTGVGMDDHVKARVFEPFFTTKPRGKGTGLGLYGVYQFVHALGGSVEVDSRPGEGTTFRLRLPAAPTGTEARAPSEPPPAPADARPSRARILLVEDEASVRALARGILAGVGHEVVEAGDGEEAVRRFAQAPTAVDLVILDLVLPRLPGAEVLRRCRALRPDVPVLLSSGNVQDGLDDPEIRGAVTGALPKPYLPADLLAAVDRALRKRAGNGLGVSPRP